MYNNRQAALLERVASSGRAVLSVCTSLAVTGVACVFACACGGDGASASRCSTQDASLEAMVVRESSTDATADAEGTGSFDAGLDAGEATLDAGEIGAFCQQTLGAVFEAFIGCCSSADQATPYFAQARAFFQATVTLCSSLAESRNEGRIAWDQTTAQACIAHFQAELSEAGTCNGLPPSIGFTDPPCDSVVTGLGTDGRPCRGAVECQDGYTCAGNGSGFCSKASSLGLHEQCANGLPLDSFVFGNLAPPCASGLYCSEGQCVAQASTGGPCASDDECVSGLTCHVSICGNGTPELAGAVCDRTGDCQSGFYCAHSALDDAGVCSARKPAGEACDGLDAYECIGVCAATSDSGLAGTCTSFCSGS